MWNFWPEYTPQAHGRRTIQQLAEHRRKSRKHLRTRCATRNGNLTRRRRPCKVSQLAMACIAFSRPMLPRSHGVTCIADRSRDSGCLASCHLWTRLAGVEGCRGVVKDQAQTDEHYPRAAANQEPHHGVITFHDRQRGEFPPSPSLQRLKANRRPLDRSVCGAMKFLSMRRLAHFVANRPRRGSVLRTRFFWWRGRHSEASECLGAKAAAANQPRPLSLRNHRNRRSGIAGQITSGAVGAGTKKLRGRISQACSSAKEFPFGKCGRRPGGTRVTLPVDEAVRVAPARSWPGSTHRHHNPTH